MRDFEIKSLSSQRGDLKIFSTEPGVMPYHYDMIGFAVLEFSEGDVKWTDIVPMVMGEDGDVVPLFEAVPEGWKFTLTLLDD